MHLVCIALAHLLAVSKLLVAWVETKVHSTANSSLRQDVKVLYRKKGKELRGRYFA